MCWPMKPLQIETTHYRAMAQILGQKEKEILTFNILAVDRGAWWIYNQPNYTQRVGQLVLKHFNSLKTNFKIYFRNNLCILDSNLFCFMRSNNIALWLSVWPCKTPPLHVNFWAHSASYSDAEQRLPVGDELEQLEIGTREILNS